MDFSDEFQQIVLKRSGTSTVYKKVPPLVNVIATKQAYAGQINPDKEDIEIS
jgi:hypothetical protein